MKRDYNFTEADSLVSRIEAIWNLKPNTVEISIGYLQPDDETCWISHRFDRKAAANAIKSARNRGLKVERDTRGYCISGELNAAWSY